MSYGFNVKTLLEVGSKKSSFEKDGSFWGLMSAKAMVSEIGLRRIWPCIVADATEGTWESWILVESNSSRLNWSSFLLWFRDRMGLEKSMFFEFSNSEEQRYL